MCIRYRAQAWRSFIDYNPRNGILAAVTQLGEVLEIYNLKDSTHVVRVGLHGEPEFQVADVYKRQKQWCGHVAPSDVAPASCQ